MDLIKGYDQKYAEFSEKLCIVHGQKIPAHDSSPYTEFIKAIAMFQPRLAWLKPLEA